MIYKKVTTASGKDIHVFDDAYEFNFMQQVLGYVETSLYRIGWSDRGTECAQRFRYLHSPYSYENYKDIDFVENIHDPEAKAIAQGLLEGKPWRKTTVNLSYPFEPHFIHAHPRADNGWTGLYYPNLEWKEEWGGETLFYSEDRKTVEFHSQYTPGRFVLFDFRIPHTFRPGTIIAPQYRYTVSTFYS